MDQPRKELEMYLREPIKRMVWQKDYTNEENEKGKTALRELLRRLDSPYTQKAAAYTRLTNHEYVGHLWTARKALERQRYCEACAEMNDVLHFQLCSQTLESIRALIRPYAEGWEQEISEADLWNEADNTISIPYHNGSRKRAREICATVLSLLKNKSKGVSKKQQPIQTSRLGYLNELCELKIALLRNDWCGACDALIDLFHFRPATDTPIRSILIRLLEHHLAEDCYDEDSKFSEKPI